MTIKEKPKEYSHIEELVVEGKHAIAIQLINKFKEKGEYNLRDYLLYNLLECEILFQQGLWEDMFKLAEETYKESLELGDDFIAIDALFEMAEALIWLGEPIKYEHIIKQGNDLLKIKNQKHSLEYKQREAKLFYIEGFFCAWIKNDADQAMKNLEQSITLFESLKDKVGLTKSLLISSFVFGTLKGEADNAIKLTERSLALSEECNSKYLVGFSLLMMGVNYAFFKGDYDHSIKFFEQGLIKFKELNNKYNIAVTFSYIGSVYMSKGDLGKALEYAELGLALAKEVNNKLRIAENFVILASIYSFKGEIDSCIRFYEQSLKIFKDIDSKVGMATVFNNLAGVNRIIGDVERALECIESSIKLNNEIGNSWAVANNYDYLIQILIDKGDVSRAQKEIEKLEQLKNQINNEQINLLYLFDKALVLKISSRIRDRGKAEEILKQIIEDERVEYGITVEVLFNLCELLLTELSMTNELKVLEEINSYTAQLLDIAEKSNSFILFAEIYFLKAKLALLTLDVKNARRFLTQAQKIAERFTLNQLAAKIKLEHNNLREQLSMWEKIKKTDISLAERIKLTGVDTQMKQILRESTIISTQITKEKIKVHRERKVCLVCKGEILGYTYICQCDAVYCQNCAQALTDLENVCWVCNAPIDTSKPTKPYKEEKMEETDTTKYKFKK